MTRPANGRGDIRSLIVKARFTAAEKKSLLELAAQAGLTTSDFIRVRTIGGKPQTHKATPARADLIRLQAELNRVGNNANQIARALNRRSDSDILAGVSAGLILDALEQIKAVTATIAATLGHSDYGDTGQ